MPNPFLRRRSVLAAAAAAIGLGGATAAMAQPELVDLRVVDRETGQTLRTWRHHGHFYVAGNPGARYALRVTNHSGGRVLVVMSVDGVNILTGETAGYDQRGYVFGPYESHDLTGWRKSDSEVAAFVFAPLPESYAARTGRPADVGVIGIAAFREKPVPPPPPPVYTPPVSARAAPSPSVTIMGGAASGDGNSSTDFRYAAPPTPPPPPPAAAPAPEMAARKAQSARAAAASPSEVTVTGSRIAQIDKLGTAHGERERSLTYSVDFERATVNPQTVLQVQYDTYDNLVAHGVIHAPERDRRPEPFPTHRQDNGYVPDPPEL